MQIIIVGCGNVGATLTEQLSKEGHNIAVIDTDAQRAESVANRFDVMGVVGNGASFNVQKEAGIEDADLLVAVTTSDELNLLCCLIARKTGGCNTVARVRNPIYNREIGYIKEELGLSMVINPEYAAAMPEIFKEKFFHNHNILIAKKKVFQDYCSWLFPVLERVEELSEPKGRDRADRYIGYLGENLTTLYFLYHKNDLNIVYTGRRMLV